MPRYDDRYGGTRLYVGKLSYRTRSRDLEDIFSRYGRAKYHPFHSCHDGLTVSGTHLRRVRHVDMKRDYAFVEFSDPRDADDARYAMDGRDVDGSRIIVEIAKGVPRGPGGSRDYLGRGSAAPGSGRCFNCGLEGHWARDCKAGDWKNKCYRCGERGHIERNCQNSPKKLRRERSYSRSPSPRRRGRGQSRSRSRSQSYSRDRSYSRSRSPVKRERSFDRVERSRSMSPVKRERSFDRVERSRSRSPVKRERSFDRVERSRSRSPVKRERSFDRVERRSISPADSPSPKRNRSSPSRSRKRSITPDEMISPERNNRSPQNHRQPNGSEYSGSPRGRSRTPNDDIGRDDFRTRRYESPAKENGRSRSPASIDDRSPIDDRNNEGSP